MSLALIIFVVSAGTLVGIGVLLFVAGCVSIIANVSKKHGSIS